jgi:hypothetical protein
MLSESLLAEVKSLIASRLGLDEGSIDVGVTVSSNNHETGQRHTESRMESRSWGWSETIGWSTCNTSTEAE